MIQKPNKPEIQISSYKPIILPTSFSKIFEKSFVTRLLPFLENGFDFVNNMEHAVPLERKIYCPAAFLVLNYAFDRVWHDVLYIILICLHAILSKLRLMQTISP